MENNIPFKLNRYITLVTLNKEEPQSSSASPNNLFSIILNQLNEWLLAISNLFSNYNDIFPSSETRSHWFAEVFHWLAVAAPFVVGGALLLCILCCCLPIIINCFIWVFVTLFNLLRGLIMMVRNSCMRVGRCLCCCARRSGKMMKAPGRGGKVFIPRASFEANPASYFQGFRASGTCRLV